MIGGRELQRTRSKRPAITVTVNVTVTITITIINTRHAEAAAPSTRVCLSRAPPEAKRSRPIPDLVNLRHAATAPPHHPTHPVASLRDQKTVSVSLRRLRNPSRALRQARRGCVWRCDGCRDEINRVGGGGGVAFVSNINSIQLLHSYIP